MKTKFFPAIVTSVVFFLVLSIIIWSCTKTASGSQKVQADNPTPESIIANADPAMTPYNLNIIMHGKYSLGFMTFRQKPDTARIINLDTWVFNLKPNRAYILQRAVNPITDSTQCSSTAWLSLGAGLTPQSIHTNRWGFGYQPLYRDITSIAHGTQFYIHFQVIDSLTNETVLTSDCNTYTVR